MDKHVEDDNERLEGVYKEHLARIMVVMREHYPRVLAANRFFEEETSIHNEVGANNLNDALSHLGTLIERANEMTCEQQGHEVHDFEGHLRRSMMESYELIYRQRMGKVSRLWSEHEALARSLQEEGKLRGVTDLDELERLRRKCRVLLDRGRAAKRGHNWDEWKAGTDALSEACQVANQLATALETAIGRANDYEKDEKRTQSSKRGLTISLVVTVVVALIAIPGTYLFAKAVEADDSTVPNVVGRGVQSTLLALGDAQLKARLDPPRANAQKCRVVSQRPRAGQKVKRGTRVSITLRC
jgi:hypothetical protein